MTARKILLFITLFSSGLLFSLGMMFVVLYVWKGAVARIGEADQSLLFWYLPVLFAGIIGMAAGTAPGLWGWRRLGGLSPADL